MNAAALLVSLHAAGDAAARAATERGIAAIADAAAAVSGVVAERGEAGVVVRGRGLAARAFGSRSRAADARLAGLVVALSGERR